MEKYIVELYDRVEERNYKMKLKEKVVRDGLVIEEEKIGKYGNLLIYSRRDRKGEGFGKRKVGMRVLIVKEYLYDKDNDGLSSGKIWVGGEIIRIVKRVNEGYYDYWYKVKLDNGKNIWRSYVKLIGGKDN